MIKKRAAFHILLMSIFILASCQGNDSNNPQNSNDTAGNPANNNEEVSNENNDSDQNNSEENDDHKEIVTKNNELGIKIMDQLAEEDADNNIFISPVSLYMALSMVSPGAENETQSEITNLLGADDTDISTFNEANQSFLETLNDKDNDDIQLDIANSLWVDQNFNPEAEYDEIIDQYFHGKIASINRDDPAAADEINDWISEQTHNKIDDVVESPLSEDFAAMLVNAVYFNSNWSFPFDEDETKDDIFHLNDDKEKEVPFMHMDEKLDYVKNDDYEAVKLPYGEDGEMSMSLFLPSKDGDLASIHQALQNDNIEDIMAEMDQTQGSISLPKFKIEYEEKMNDVLKQLGMEQAFDKELADFPNMIEEDESLYISTIKHSTYIDVNEEGTEAAGSTSVEMETTSMPVDEPFDLTFDHPFTMLITDEETGAVLFMGDIYDVAP